MNFNYWKNEANANRILLATTLLASASLSIIPLAIRKCTHQWNYCRDLCNKCGVTAEEAVERGWVLRREMPRSLAYESLRKYGSSVG